MYQRHCATCNAQLTRQDLNNGNILCSVCFAPWWAEAQIALKEQLEKFLNKKG